MNTDMKSINIINHPLTVPKFHGHMKLELRGSRETEVIEHDNNMTNALEILLDSYGLWMNPGAVMDSLCPTIENAFGGILLTDKTLEDGCVAVPGGTEVTACAAYGIANADEALTQGSYNASESVLDLPSKKMTYVYDWATNQGNGTIAAAALTNINGGVCSYGDAGLKNNNYSYYFDTKIKGNIRMSPYTTRLCLVNDDYEIYASMGDNNKISIYKCPGVAKSVMPFSLKSDNQNKLEYEKYLKYEFTTTDLTTVLNSYTDGTNIYFCNSENYNPGSSFILYVLNSDEMTLNEIVIKNQTEGYIYTRNGFEIYNNYLYINDYYGKYIYEININNSADVNKYETGSTNALLLNSTINLCNGKIFMNKNNRICIFDTVTKSLKEAKTYESYIYKIINKSICRIGESFNISGNYSYVYRSIPAIYLATNNNLDKPVTKTPDKTMKVTYTIQEE